LGRSVYHKCEPLGRVDPLPPDAQSAAIQKGWYFYYNDRPARVLKASTWQRQGPSAKLTLIAAREIGIMLPNKQRQHRTLHIQKDVLPYTSC
jgi:hypothetical protein